MEGLGDPDVVLSAVAVDPRIQAPMLEAAIARWLSSPDTPPVDAVLVQGDTTSAYAGMLVAKAAKLPLIHLEAGVRSHDLQNPSPEEEFRVAIDREAGLLLAPTTAQMYNLCLERAGGTIVTIGNTVADDLEGLGWLGGVNFGLVTLHRRESIDNGDLALLAEQIGALDQMVLWPLHPNPGVQRVVRPIVKDRWNVVLLDPLSHDAFLSLLRRCAWVLTDSGGVQEEAAILGTPTIVARRCTDRPEALMAPYRVLHRVDSGDTLSGVVDRLGRVETPPIPYGGYRSLSGLPVSEVAAEVILEWVRGLDRSDVVLDELGVSL